MQPPIAFQSLGVGLVGLTACLAGLLTTDTILIGVPPTGPGIGVPGGSLRAAGRSQDKEGVSTWGHIWMRTCSGCPGLGLGRQETGRGLSLLFQAGVQAHKRG